MYNPSFVAQDKCHGLLLHSYQKFPSIDLGYMASDFVYYGFYPVYNSGFALSASYDRQPGGVFSYTSLDLAYIYNIVFSRKISLALNLDFEYNQFSVNSSGLVFSSSLDPVRGIVSSSTYPDQTYRNLAFSSGFLLYGNNFFLGAEVNNIAWLAITESREIERQVVFTLGYTYRFYKHNTFLETYLIQQSLNWTELGVLLTDSFYWVSVAANLGNDNAQLRKLSFDLGLRRGKVLAGVNYSVYLGGFVGSAYELSLKYEIKCKKNKRKAIICPAYQL